MRSTSYSPGGGGSSSSEGSPSGSTQPSGYSSDRRLKCLHSASHSSTPMGNTWERWEAGHRLCVAHASRGVPSMRATLAPG